MCAWAVDVAGSIVRYSFYVRKSLAEELAPKDKIKIVARDLFTAMAQMCSELRRSRSLARNPLHMLKMLAGVARDVPLLRALAWVDDQRVAEEVLAWISNWVCRCKWYGGEGGEGEEAS